jgi:hypothetical protein
MGDITINPTLVRAEQGSNVTPRTMGENGQLGNLVYPTGNDTVMLCDANDSATVDGLIGMIVGGMTNSGLPRADGTVKSGERVDVVWFGRVEVGEVLDLTKNYFASNTTGAVSDTAGAVTRRIGQPESTHVLFFNASTTSATS